MQDVNFRTGQQIARGGEEAGYFYMIERGTVAVYHDGLQVAVLAAGGYFGTAALTASGSYEFTFRADSDVHLVAVAREDFDPLLRADTTLAQQVTSGAKERDLLKKMALFNSLSPQELAMVDARLESREVKAGEVFVRQGQPRSHLFIIAEGTVEVFTTQEDGIEKINGRLAVGEHFGEYALFADTPYSASCRTVTDCRLLLLDEPTFDSLVASYERMSHYVEQIGSGRLMVSQRQANAAAILS
jgi:CRP-like cAMP-binding protein